MQNLKVETKNPCITEGKLCLSFWDWIDLTIISRSIYVPKILHVSKLNTFSLYKCITFSLLIHELTGRYGGYFHFLDIMNGVAMNTDEQMSL